MVYGLQTLARPTSGIRTTSPRMVKKVFGSGLKTELRESRKGCNATSLRNEAIDMSKKKRYHEHDRFEHRAKAYHKYEVQRRREEEFEEEMHDDMSIELEQETRAQRA